MTLQVACEQFLTVDEVTCDCEGLTDDQINDVIDSASDVLAILTGGAVSGRCSETVRPRGPDGCSCGSRSLRSCRCSRMSGITLRGPDPVVSQITIDGRAFSDYKIADGLTLLRTDGASWPGCQDITLPNGAVGAFAITYKYGDPITYLAKQAAIEIVCSFLRNPAPRQKSHPNTRGVSIAGVSISLEQQAMEVRRRTFMMPFVIRLLTVYAPDGPAPAAVYSPELEDGWKLHRML